MSEYKYSTELKENMCKAVGLGLPISSKQSIEICNKIRGMKLDKALVYLDSVIELKQAVPFRRFTNIPHQVGTGPGRFPIKSSSHIHKILKSAEANAQFKGLSVNNLFIKHISAQKGSKTIRYGRRRTQTKRTNIEVVLEEKK